MGGTLNNEPTTLELRAAQGAGDLNAFYWRQIFVLDSAVVKTQKLFSSHGGYLNKCNA